MASVELSPQEIQLLGLIISKVDPTGINFEIVKLREKLLATQQIAEVPAQTEEAAQ